MSSVQHSFGNGRLLPTFDEYDGQVERFVSGYFELRNLYDGWKNRIEIQPYRQRDLLSRPEMVGLPYTIGVAHLMDYVIRGFAVNKF